MCWGKLKQMEKTLTMLIILLEFQDLNKRIFWAVKEKIKGLKNKIKQSRCLHISLQNIQSQESVERHIKSNQ